MQRISPHEPGKALPESDEEFWLFGYGSLIWKPPPHFDHRVPGYIEGYVRRFWQASEDHRGTPESPGRVVTLIGRSFWETLGEEPSSTRTRVYGAAYHIPPPHIQTVKAYLDIREINGYSIQYTPSIPIPTNTHSHSQPPIPNCTVYIGLPDNPQFLGKQDPQDVAAVIAKSVGPSGKNSEYLFMLEGALEALAPESGDEHVGDLARRVRGLMGGGEGEGALGKGQLAGNAVENEAERARSGIGGKPVEEIEKAT